MRRRQKLSSLVAMMLAGVLFGGGFALSVGLPASNGDALAMVDLPEETDPWEETGDEVDDLGTCEAPCLAYDGLCLCLQ